LVLHVEYLILLALNGPCIFHFLIT
jgi:hypothetical protein